MPRGNAVHSYTTGKGGRMRAHSDQQCHSARKCVSRVQMHRDGAVECTVPSVAWRMLCSGPSAALIRPTTVGPVRDRNSSRSPASPPPNFRFGGPYKRPKVLQQCPAAGRITPTCKMRSCIILNLYCCSNAFEDHVAYLYHAFSSVSSPLMEDSIARVRPSGTMGS